MTEPIESGRVILRPMTDDELIGMMEKSFGGGPSWSFAPFGMERVILQVTEERSKLDRSSFSGAISQVVLALQLIGFELSGRGPIVQSDLPVRVSIRQAVVPFKVGPLGSTCRCTAPDLDAALRLVAKMPALGELPQRSSDVALNRFRQGCADESAADALVDFVIALEAVLLPPESADVRRDGELRFRLSLNGARLLGSETQQRRQIWKDLRRVYDERSSIVHGGILDQQVISELFPVARRLAADVLRHGLTNGWPTSSDFVAKALE